MSLHGKMSTVLALPLGIAYGSIPIYMEETAQWVTSDSLTYFGISAPVILGIGYLVWSKTRLLPRGKTSQS